uniref:MULE transposase domain-containing protein n=1 Tax=Panagrolaimus sp. ES5 TaxID=591445 RepID=A0AC34FCD1_9BILA
MHSNIIGIIESAKTSKGNEIVYLNGYEWVRHYPNKARTKQLWRCPRNNECRASAESDYGKTELTVLREHYHFADPHSELVRDKMQEAKSLAKQNINSHILPPRGIWTKIIDGLNLEQRACLPDYPAFRQLINMQRVLPETALVDKPEIKDIKIEGQHLLDANGNNFLLFDSRKSHPKEPPMLIFGSPEGVLRLSEYPDWAMDGTFYVAPKPWKQLYLINVLIDKSSLPAIYVLLTAKSQQTYSLLFQEISALLPSEFSPASIIVDNERAAVNALKLAWPKAPVRLCIFHLAQALYHR